MIQAFKSICEFRQQNPGTRGNAIYSNDTKLTGVKKHLVEIENWLKEHFGNFKNVDLNFEHSKGITYFPSVLHVSILPPAQKVSRGIYVVICFDLLGRGALVGCAESKTNPQGLNTLNRTKNKHLDIDVNGLRNTTKYNDTFENPKEFFYENFNIEEFEIHIKNSLELCLYHLQLNKDPDISIFSLVQANPLIEFDPDNITTAKEKVSKLISKRRGQKKFRENLLSAYNNKCTISGCEVQEILEAAHIIPYQGEETNAVVNGLLLRSDLHTMFDLALITINAEDYKIKVSPVINDPIYRAYHNKNAFIPHNVKFLPSKKALSYHNEVYNQLLI